MRWQGEKKLTANLRLKDRKCSLRTLIGTNLTTIVLMALLTVSLVSAAATINVYMDDYPATATYTVKSDGTNFWRVRYDGRVESEGTDAYVVINAAITATNALGSGRVFLDIIGTVTINSPIIMKSKVLLQGLGMYATILKAKNALDRGIIETTLTGGARYTGIVIMDIGFNGNGANQDAPSVPLERYPCGLILWDCNYPIVQRCYFYDCKQYGVYLQGGNAAGEGGEISSCLFNNCDWNAITVGGSGAASQQPHAKVFGNTIIGSADVGVSTYSAYTQISDNNIRYCQGALGDGGANSGWGIGTEGADSDYCTIADNNIYDCDAGVVISAGGTGNTVDGGTYDNMDSFGIGITESNLNVVGGAKITQSANGIYIETADENDIKNVVCRDATAHGLTIIDAAADNTWIEGCDFKGCADDVSDIGTGTAFGYNRWANGTYSEGTP